MSTPYTGLDFLPPALAQALNDFGAMTRADQMVLVIQHGAGVTTVALPGGDPRATYRLLDRATLLAQERVATLAAEGRLAPDDPGEGGDV